ncbi:MAG: hypothetical protein E7371_05110 [Clostridiales bacterium]|nr:hypothetical protein [Clostridiales bacterium]
MKKKFLAWLTLACMSVSVCGCNNSTDNSASNDNSSNSVQSSSDEQTFETLFQTGISLNINMGETQNCVIEKDLGDRNYIKIEYESDVDLYGEFVYTNLADPTQEVCEPFFLEAGETVFKQFLDAYRPNGVGLFEKHLKKITVQNVDVKKGTQCIKNVAVSGRDIPEKDCELYLIKNGLKIGVDLALGGSLTFVGRTDYQGETVDEIIDKDGNIKYGVNAKSQAGATHLSSDVNLVTIYDVGRQIQQSYYAEVGGTDDKKTGANGYDRGWCYTDSSEGDWWSYNPVQAGDCADNPAQLIDYEISNGEIYVKARPMDWGKGWKDEWASKYEKKAKELGSVEALGLVKGGVTTKSYAENWYKIKGGMLYVDNEFIDWNGFSDMDSIPYRNQEIPAFFPVHTLHTFITYTGKTPWGGDTVGLVKNTEVGSRGDGGQREVGSENWFAWVNDDDFGMGLYVPNVDYYVYSKITPSASKDAPHNQGAYNAPMVTDPALMKNKAQPSSNYTSCYVVNACYTAPVVGATMREYVPLRYQYVLAIDNVNAMRSNFYDLHESGLITNESFSAWRG